MRHLAFVLVIVGIFIIAAACQDVLPETEIMRRIITPTDQSRGPLDEMGTMDEATPTFTLQPGVFLYLHDNPPGFNCRSAILTPQATAPPIWTRTIEECGIGCTDPSDWLLICNTLGGQIEFRFEALGAHKGWTTSSGYLLDCASGVCSESSGLPWQPTVEYVGPCGLGGSEWEMPADSETTVVLGSYITPAEEANSAGYQMITNAGSFWNCIADAWHGYEFELLATPEGGTGECSCDICISEINATQDITPTTSAHLDYNLRAGQGADDEFVEVACATPMSAAGWSLTDGTTSYIYAEDNFCWPLKTIFCDEMQECDTETGFASSGTWQLYDTDGNLCDTRSYPVVATPGNSWTANVYTNTNGLWSEQKPLPGTFPTNTPTPTPTPTSTATPTFTPTP